MKWIMVIVSLSSLITISYGQANLDNIWLFGYETDSSLPQFGGSVMDFNNDTLLMYTHDREMPFDATNASICDDSGHLLFYTNGVYIANFVHDTIENGGCCLNPMELNNVDGNRVPQGTIILPFPENEKEYYLIHGGRRLIQGDFLDAGGGPIYYSHLDMEVNNGFGKVLEKNIPIISDTLDIGKLTATRHANGRDWWLTVPEFRSNLFYKLLLTPEGVNLSTQSIGEPVANGLGQAVFAPDGSVYANITLNSFVDCAAHIYRFDRCSGELYDPVYIPINCGAAAAGVAISPNSRFLYLLVHTVIYQIDLWSDDWEASMQEVAVYDGYEEPIPGFDSLFFPTRFFLGQLAPNGKIYINTTNGVKSLHVINQPDSLGMACDVQQHAIQLPTLNAFSLPNFPNYQLRAKQGSLCDSLGPLAQFSKNSLGLEVQFTDESTANPNAWEWDFGDGASSIEQHPLHFYTAVGTYEVCLRVSNDYSSDLVCETLVISTDNVKVFPDRVIQSQIYPSPVHNTATILADGIPAGLKVLDFYLYNLLGQVKHNQILNVHEGRIQKKLDLTRLSSGIYTYVLQSHGRVIAKGKLVKN